MKENLDKWIGTLSHQSAPHCPDALEDNVLRCIRETQTASDDETIIGWFNGLIPRTGFSLSAIALVVAVSAMATALSAVAVTADRKAEINRALGFDTITTTQVVNLER